MLVPFTAQTRMSGMDFPDGRQVRKGAADSVRRLVVAEGGHVPRRALADRRRISSPAGHPAGGRPRDAGAAAILGVIHLKDIVKPGMRERFDELRAMGIRTVMITGDNPLTARAIADRGRRRRLPGRGHARGQDGAHPREQEGGRLVAMTGDGTNDAPPWPRPTSAWR